MITLTTAQVSFFTENGYLELEGLFTPEECEKYLAALREHAGRDIWRQAPVLKKLVTSRQMAQIACLSTRKQTVRLACDHRFEAGYGLPKQEKLKDLLSIQGVVLALFIQLEPGHYQLPAKSTQLGITPFPKGQGSALLVSPKILLNWPASNLELYMIVYAEPSAIYVNNPKDAAKAALKKLGYGYGDPLRSDTHPLLNRPS